MRAANRDRRRMELVCPAGGLAALKAAVDHGADSVYVGFQDGTNARSFGGLNFDQASARAGVQYAHAAGVKVLVALNTYPRDDSWHTATGAVDHAAELGVDALILADPGLLAYAAERYPDLARHLSVQGSATNEEALAWYQRTFGIRRAVLPRVLSLAQVERVCANAPVEIEVFGFGSLCVMVEGRCALSSYVTGDSPNTAGVCSPARAVQWRKTPRGMESRLNGVLIDCYADDENAGYPTLCKGRFTVAGETGYAIEEPTSLNTLEILPELARAGVTAIKIEGRQRSPAYVAQVTRVWRHALDAWYAAPDRFVVQTNWLHQLDKVAEGQQHTLGAYHRSWK